jgi:hypothetical protein
LLRSCNLGLAGGFCIGVLGLPAFFQEVRNVATATAKAPPRPSRNHIADVSPRIAQRMKWREELAAAEASANEELTAAIAECQAAEVPLRDRGRLEFLSGDQRYRRALAVAKVDAATTKLEITGNKYRQALIGDLTPGERDEIWAFRREFNQRRDVLNATSVAPEEATRACQALDALKFKTDDEKAIMRHNARTALEALERQKALSKVIGEILMQANDGPDRLELAADFRAEMHKLRSRVLDVEAAEYHVEIQ